MKRHDNFFDGQTFLGACIFGRAFLLFRDILLTHFLGVLVNTMDTYILIVKSKS